MKALVIRYKELTIEVYLDTLLMISTLSIILYFH